MPDADLYQPNVIIIIMDDLAWGDLSCHGNPLTHTPSLDRLQSESARLNGYRSGPLCSPARASLMTGRYHLRTRVLDTYCGRSMMDPDERTLAECLQAAGYRTGAFGKWHLGDGYPMRPNDKGFESTLTHLGGGIGQPGDHIDNWRRRAESYFDPVLFRNGKPEKTQGYCTDVFTDAALEFIDHHREEPFFVYLATNAPHSPHTIGDQWADRFRKQGVNETHARVYGMVENIDHNVGRVLDKLDELGLAEDTIVIFTSDHGPCPSAKDRTAPPEKQDRFNAGLRGIKGTMYEGGVRAPCFWRWPRRIAAALDIDRPAHPIDFLPTVAAACGVAVPDDRAMDGVNLLPLMTGEAPPERWPERTIYMQWHRGDLPVRYRNYAVIDDRFKLYRRSEDRPDELYDLAADPYEQQDLAAQQPDRVTAMRESYDAWLDDMAATRGPGTFDPPPIHVGDPACNPTTLSQQDWRIHGEEGWQHDDLRGHYEVRVVAAGKYRVTLHFKDQVVAGEVHFTCDDVHVHRHADAGEDGCVFEGVHLPAGLARMEAWRTTDEPTPGAHYRRYVPAVYIDLECV